MKAMGKPPPRSAKSDKALREVYAIREEVKHKPPTPWQSDMDQMGPGWDAPARGPGLFDCCVCGEPFALEKSFVHSGDWGTFWCEACFREMAKDKYGIS